MRDGIQVSSICQVSKQSQSVVPLAVFSTMLLCQEPQGGSEQFTGITCSLPLCSLGPNLKREGQQGFAAAFLPVLTPTPSELSFLSLFSFYVLL